MAEIMYEPSGCNCDGTSYSRADIDAAAKKALELASQGQTLGRDKYPHAYNDYEHFSFSNAAKPYLEYPIMANEEVYNGGSPSTDRVIIGSIAEDYSSAVYCAVITHKGEKHDAFRECQDVGAPEDGGDGTGSDATSATDVERRRKHRQGGRKLIERINL